jgi:hypothetical protein
MLLASPGTTRTAFVAKRESSRPSYSRSDRGSVRWSGQVFEIAYLVRRLGETITVDMEVGGMLISEDLGVFAWQAGEV